MDLGLAFMTVFAQHALAVNHKGRRQSPDAAKAVDLRSRLVRGEKAETMGHFFDRGQVFGRVHADGDHLQTLGLVFAVIRLNARHFRLTRRAPGGPEIDDDDLAFVFGQAKHPALQHVSGFEIRRGFANRQALRHRTGGQQAGTGQQQKLKQYMSHVRSVGAPAL